MPKKPVETAGSKTANILHSDQAAGLRRTLGIMLPEELAMALHVSDHSIHAWRRAGEGPQHTRLGRRVYYRVADVNAWVDQNVGREWAGATDECDHDWINDVDGLTCKICGAHGELVDVLE